MDTRESSKYSFIQCLVYADVIPDQQAENTSAEVNYSYLPF